MNKKKLKKIAKELIVLFKTKKSIAIPTQVNSTELLKDKVALITGGSGGIGFAIAENFILNGAKVIIAGTNEEKLSRCQQKLDYGRNVCKYIVLDVLNVDGMYKKVIEAMSMFPEKRIDILVNSAGVLNHGSFEEITEEVYDTVMNINAKGTFFMCQAVSKYMVENGVKGHILNVTSSSALRPAWTPYQMSKWAVRGLTLGLADTLLPHGIIVNAIAPGPVATEMLGVKEGDNIYTAKSPSERYALPNEIAQLAAFMVSDMGNLIVGDTFYMTGGSGTISYHS